MLEDKPDIDKDILKYMKTLTILFVEDSSTIQLIYKSIFEDYVRDILFAKDGLYGYSRFTENKVDIIVTDYSMPNLNGIDMIKKIRLKNKNIPIILVSNIENIKVIKQAIRLKIQYFIEKPIDSYEMIDSIVEVSKLLFAEDYIKKERQLSLNKLHQKTEYSSSQEEQAFTQQLNILRNDFYYQTINAGFPSMLNFMYLPLDTLSGDSYSARKIDANLNFYILVDGMGKGISASLSSMMFTSFVNHIIDVSDKFDFNDTIKQAISYIQTILLEEEILSVDFLLLDCKSKELNFSKFAMPVSLIQTETNEILKIKSNNPPLSKFTKEFKIDKLSIENSIKFLFYSDGLTENSIYNDDGTYADFLENDFLNSFTKDELRDKFLAKIAKQEDDVTFIFINKLPSKETQHTMSKSFNSTMHSADIASVWYDDIWNNFTDNKNEHNKASIVFTEFFMNALEHGNLGINKADKHRLLQEGTYYDLIDDIEKTCNKKINVTVNKIKHANSFYIITNITDTGEGFDTNELRGSFTKISKLKFNGRGIYMAREYSLGIYFNQKGNSVIFIHKV